MASKSFSSMEIDAIGEILNISLGASATAISTMLNTRVDITTPQVSVVRADEFCFSDLEPAIGVEINYVSGLDGKNIMLLKRSDIKMIVELLLGSEIPDEEFELDEMNLSAVCEVMNQMMGASSTALSEFLERPVNISTPVSFEINSEDTFKDMYFTTDDKMVVVKFLLNIDGRLKSEFINVMPTLLVKELLSVFFPEEAESGDEQEDGQESEPAAGQTAAFGGEQPMAGGGAAVEIAGQMAGYQGESNRYIENQPAAQGRPLSQDQIFPQGQTLPQSQTLPQGQALQQSQMLPQGQLLSQGQPQGQPFPQNQPLPQGQPLSQGQPFPQGQPFLQGRQPCQPDMASMMPQAAGYDYQLQQQMQLQQMMAHIESLQNEIRSLKKQEGKTISGAPVQLSGLEGSGLAGEEQEENLDLLMGVSLEIAVEIGRTRSQVKDILEFTKGTLVILDKLAGDPVDLYVNGRCVAKGDVVVVDDSFGIRISEIVKRQM